MQLTYSYLAYEIPVLLVLFGGASVGLVALRQRPGLWAASWVLLLWAVVRAWLGSLAARERLGLGAPRVGSYTVGELVLGVDGLLLTTCLLTGLVAFAWFRLVRFRRFRLWRHRLRSLLGEDRDS